jgi:hypothetical protein
LNLLLKWLSAGAAARKRPSVMPVAPLMPFAGVVSVRALTDTHLEHLIYLVTTPIGVLAHSRAGHGFAIVKLDDQNTAE